MAKANDSVDIQCEAMGKENVPGKTINSCLELTLCLLSILDQIPEVEKSEQELVKVVKGYKRLADGWIQCRYFCH